MWLFWLLLGEDDNIMYKRHLNEKRAHTICVVTQNARFRICFELNCIALVIEIYRILSFFHSYNIFRMGRAPDSLRVMCVVLSFSYVYGFAVVVHRIVYDGYGVYYIVGWMMMTRCFVYSFTHARGLCGFAISGLCVRDSSGCLGVCVWLWEVRYIVAHANRQIGLCAGLSGFVETLWLYAVMACGLSGSEFWG